MLLFAANMLVATQREVTRGLLWPSKLAVLKHVPRPLLWIGPKAGSIAKTLKRLPNAGIFGADEPREIASWIKSKAQAGDYLPYRPAN